MPKWMGETVVKPEIAITYGVFIDAFINLLIISITLFFFIKLVNQMREKLEKLKKKAEDEAKAQETPAVPAVPEDIALLTEIRDLLREQSNRTRE